MGSKKITLCGCGYGKPTHKWKDMEGLRVHILGEGTCCRMEAKGDDIPVRFYEADFHGDGRMIKVVDTGKETLTEYTLRNQRMYSYHEESGVWSLPKNRGSINSIGDNW
jgi:hypothetical protein